MTRAWQQTRCTRCGHEETRYSNVRRCRACGGVIERPAIPANAALQSVIDERARQDQKWGEQNHDPFTYLAVLTEEVGELAQAALHLRFGGPAAAGLREEAVHVAAVALAIVECLDRGTWRWPVEA